MAECRSTSKHKHKLQRGKGIDRFNCQTQDLVGTRIFLSPQLRTSPPSDTRFRDFKIHRNRNRGRIERGKRFIITGGACKFAEINRDDWIYLGKRTCESLRAELNRSNFFKLRAYVVSFPPWTFALQIFRSAGSN